MRVFTPVPVLVVLTLLGPAFAGVAVCNVSGGDDRSSFLALRDQGEGDQEGRDPGRRENRRERRLKRRFKRRFERNNNNNNSNGVADPWSYPSCQNSANCLTCDKNRQCAFSGPCDNTAWCHFDGVTPDISCTAFTAKIPFNSAGCQLPEMDTFAGGQGKAYFWQSDNADNFWVIHSCDWAGLMTGDCKGNKFYMEQYGQTEPNYPFPTPPSQPHWRSQFQNPGSYKTYKTYDAGMWAPGSFYNGNTWVYGTWPDQEAGKTWWPTMQKYLPDIKDLAGMSAQAASGKLLFVVMYPWVCDYDNTGSPYGYQYFWGPVLKPYGQNTIHVKCYYDNEPVDNIHFGSKKMPPAWKAYKFYFDQASQQVKGWLLGEYENYQDNPAIVPTMYLPQRKYFWLKGKGYTPPW